MRATASASDGRALRMVRLESMIQDWRKEAPLGKQNPQGAAETERAARSVRYCGKPSIEAISLCISSKFTGREPRWSAKSEDAVPSETRPLALHSVCKSVVANLAEGMSGAAL